MGVLAAFDDPLYWGIGGISPEVPGTFDVSIDGHPYMIDTTFEFGRRDSFRHSSIPAQRDATDIGNQPGENSINPQGLWRSEVYDWSFGAGQRFADRAGSVPNRFRESVGVDPFTNQWYLSLLPTTEQVLAETDDSTQVVVVGEYVYVMTSTTLKFSTDLSSWTTVTGLPDSGLVMMATDAGYDVWIACGTNLLYRTTAGSSSASQYVTSGSSGNGIYFVAFAANTLFVAQGSSMYVITTSGALPSALMTGPNENWTWTALCGGYGWIYMAGYVGNYSTIYATQNEADGTALTAPTISGPLPPGEICYSLFPFVNFVWVGTTLGVRFCITLGPEDAGGSPGDLKMGAIVPNLVQPVTYPVRCFTAQDRFVWFGWSNYSPSTTGLGKLDVSSYTGPQTPAYCSDLMVTESGEITSMDFFPGAPNTLVPGIPGSPIFVVKGSGVYVAGSTYVGSGNVQSGYIGFRIPDKKVLISYSVDTTNDTSEIGASVEQDDENTYSLGTSTDVEGNLFSIPQVYGELFETTLTLYSGASNTTSPTVRRATLQAYPAITSGTNFIAALRFFDKVQTHGPDRTMDVYSELQFLESLRQNQTVVSFQEGSVSWAVVITDIDMVWYQRSQLPAGGFNGVCVVTMQTAASGLIT